MAQLESDTALGALEDPSTRHRLIMIIESGLRAGDACRPRLGCSVADGVGAPCLRFINTKVGAEQLIPLAARAAEAIRAQEVGHTLGTRTINRGVQQRVVQHLLGHASPQLTDTYARLFDSTVREAFEAFCATRVDIDGHHLPYSPDAPTSDAEWIKHHLSHIEASLPNGSCGRPPKQDCPHPNVHCPNFRSEKILLPVLQLQRVDAEALLADAKERGWGEEAARHRRLIERIDALIASSRVG